MRSNLHRGGLRPDRVLLPILQLHHFVTGGGGARPYPIERTPDDPLYGKAVNYHYLLVDFVFLVLHHPPYTASFERAPGSGHSARHPEQSLAQMLEERQSRTHVRLVVFSGHVHNYEYQEHNGVIGGFNEIGNLNSGCKSRCAQHGMWQQ